MTQPKFAPIERADEVRPSAHLGVPRAWTADRPGEFRPNRPQTLRGRGIPGPDQGYMLKLARRFADRLILHAGEHPDDVLSGACAIALRRAALFGRAPVSADLEVVLGIFGYLDVAPVDLVEVRQQLFSGASHHYWQERGLVAQFPQATLLLSPSDVRADLGGWRGLIGELADPNDRSE